MADFQRAERLANDTLSRLNGQDFANMDHVRQNIEQRLQGMLASFRRWKSVSAADSDAVQRIRDEIADSRSSLHPCPAMLDEVREEWARRYRMQIGGDKEAFEKLSDTMQQQTSPSAYQYKRNFAEVSALIDAVHHLNGELMDVGSQLEQANLGTKPPADPGNIDRIDTDPAPSANRS